MACFGDKVGDILEAAGILVNPPANLLNPEDGHILKGTPEPDILAGVSRNAGYVRELTKQLGVRINQYGASRLRSPTRYYNPVTRNYQSYPPMNNVGTLEVADQFVHLAEILGVLVFNKALDLTTILDIPTIDQFTGAYCTPPEEAAFNELSELLGVPASGVFALSEQVNNINTFGHTFTGVDLRAQAAFGDVITEVKGMTLLSWSIHRDKNSNRRSYESIPTSHPKGAKTIAGSIIFTLFDENPVRAMTPMQYFHGNDPVVGPDGLTEMYEMLSTDIPGFDMAISLDNEYGAVSATVIYGIEFTDEGGSFSMRQMENEVVLQYKALGMDPIKPVTLGPERELNIFGIGQKGAQLFEKRRRVILNGEMAAGGDFEAVYKRTMDTIADNLNLGEDIATIPF